MRNAITLARLSRTVISAFAILIIQTFPAPAETAAQALERFGAIGTWSADCSDDRQLRSTISAQPFGKTTSVWLAPNNVWVWDIDEAEIIEGNKLKTTRHLVERLVNNNVAKITDAGEVITISIRDGNKVRVMDQYPKDRSNILAKDGFQYVPNPDLDISQRFKAPWVKTDKQTPFTKQCATSEGGTAARQPPASGASETKDPVIQKLAIDIKRPILFVLHDVIAVENNWNLSGAGDKLISLEKTGECGSALNAQDLQFQYMPLASWLAGNVLHRLVGTGLKEKSPGHYEATPSLLRLARQRCVHRFGERIDDFGTYSVYDLGKFVLTDGEIVNEFTGPDRQTGATTKFRSYKVTVEFRANPAVAATVGAEVLGRGNWTVAWGMNPVTLQWVYSQFGDGTWSTD